MPKRNISFAPMLACCNNILYNCSCKLYFFGFLGKLSLINGDVYVLCKGG